MIYGLFFRRYAPFDTFGGGFEGDHRTSASTSLTATARTIGALHFSPENVGPISGDTSGTTYAGFGSYVQQLLGKHYSKVLSKVSVITRTVESLRFTAETSGANPMVPGAPAIDTYVQIDIVFRGQAIAIDGIVTGDDFPNAEVFVTDAIGQSQLLFEFNTSGGQTTGPITRLGGDHRSQVLGKFSKLIPLRPGGAFSQVKLN